MSGLIYEVGQKYPQVEIEVIPGVTAAMSGGAVLGAPLIHDFAVISLSDLLTPGRKLKSGFWLRRRRTLPSACTTPPAGSGRTISAGPVTCCSWFRSPRRSAERCATSGGRERLPRYAPWPSSGSWRRTCLPPSLWATPRPGPWGPYGDPPEDTGYEKSPAFFRHQRRQPPGPVPGGAGWLVTVCTATEYGERSAPRHANIRVHAGRMDRAEMEAFLAADTFEVVIDGTHPYAQAVSENLRGACQARNLPLCGSCAGTRAGRGWWRCPPPRRPPSF